MPVSSQSVFIGGTGRSGTTILARILGRHPDVHTMRWETQLLTHPQGLIEMHARGYRWKDRWRFYRLLRGNFYRRVVRAGAPDAYEAGLCADVPKTVLLKAIWRFNRRLVANRGNESRRKVSADLVHELFVPAMQRAEAIAWCEKTPSNVLYFRELREMFPGARFLHIVRDPRDVICSMLQKNFWPVAPSPRVPGSGEFRGDVTFEKAVAYWGGIMRVAQVDKEVLGDSLMTLRLEDLVSDAEFEVAHVVDFLGLRADREAIMRMVSPGDEASGLPESVNEQHANIERWRDELAPSQLMYIEHELSDLMQLHGYRPASEYLS